MLRPTSLGTSSSSTAAGSLDTAVAGVHDAHISAALRTPTLPAAVRTRSDATLMESHAPGHDRSVVVELRGIKKSYGAKEVLHGVALTVHAGEHVVIFGPSGSGKSTLLRTINMLEEPSEGSVRVLGVEYGPGLGGKEKRGGPLQLRRHVGMVFQ